MTWKVRLTKISSTHNNLRTDSIEGEAAYLPAIGLPFVMFGDALTPNGVHRMVMTTNVQIILEDNEGGVIEFDTENSKYKLELLV